MELIEDTGGIPVESRQVQKGKTVGVPSSDEKPSCFCRPGDSNPRPPGLALYHGSRSTTPDRSATKSVPSQSRQSQSRHFLSGRSGWSLHRTILSRAIANRRKSTGRGRCWRSRGQRIARIGSLAVAWFGRWFYVFCGFWNEGNWTALPRQVSQRPISAERQSHPHRDLVGLDSRISSWIRRRSLTKNENASFKKMIMQKRHRTRLYQSGFSLRNVVASCSSDRGEFASRPVPSGPAC